MKSSERHQCKADEDEGLCGTRTSRNHEKDEQDVQYTTNEKANAVNFIATEKSAFSVPYSALNFLHDYKIMCDEYTWLVGGGLSVCEFFNNRSKHSYE